MARAGSGCRSDLGDCHHRNLLHGHVYHFHSGTLGDVRFLRLDHHSNRHLAQHQPYHPLALVGEPLVDFGTFCDLARGILQMLVFPQAWLVTELL